MAVALLAWMLDADEHSPAVSAPGNAGDLTFLWPYEKTTNFAGHGIAYKHLVITLAAEIPSVGIDAVGLDPQHPIAVEGKAVGRVEHVVWIDVARTCIRVRMNSWIASDHIQIPGEGRG